MVTIISSNMPRNIAADPFLSAFGSHLQSLRKKKGLSQEETADRAGVHVTYLSGIERGFRNPSIRNVRRLAQALSVPTRELFFFDDPSHKNHS